MPKLKRVITFWEALAINIGAIIGAGIFAISGLAAGIAGPSVLISIAIGAAIALVTGLSVAALAHVYAREGGGYEYSRRTLGRYMGLVAGLTFAISGSIGGAVMVLSFGGYLASSLGNAVSPVLIAIAAVVVLGLINYVGVKDSARLSAALTVIKLLVLALFVLVGVFFIKPANYVPFVPNGWSSVLVGSAFIFFAYTGFARVTTLGEEVKNPKRTIPKVILSSVLISMIVYLAVMVVLIGMTSYGNVAGSASPLATAIIAATHDQLIGTVIAIGAMFATINVALMMILGLSRVIFAMARNGDLPAVFSRLSRFGTPSYAILFTSAMMVAAILATSYRQIVAMSNAGSLLSYMVINGALLALLMRKPGVFGREMYGRGYFKAVPVMGIILALILMSFLTALSIGLIAVVLVLITLYYLFLRGRRGR